MTRDLLCRLDESVAFLRDHTPQRPRLAVVLGSGWDAFGDALRTDAELRYDQIPHFPRPQVHAGVMRMGSVRGVSVACMCGRCHGYEGHSASDAVYPVRALARWGVEAVVLTNAAGGIAKQLDPGDIMIIEDHVNLTGTNPLLGETDALGPRFVDMTEAYDRPLQAAAREAAARMGVAVESGVYAGVLGPMYETPAEIRAMQAQGIDAVGMSTVWETIALRQMGAPVLGISCITNKAAGLTPARLSHDEVLQTAQRVQRKCVSLLAEIVGSFGH